ncbi:putative MFS transporter superfamily [Helianthus annuus]|nr:putative MFS transporter superfamily [Helianthus annuus]
MSEENPETNEVVTAPRRPRSMEDDDSRHSVDVKAMEDDESGRSMDVKAMDTSVEVKSETESEDYEEYEEDKPTRGEVMGWCFYELSSYFTHTVLITVVFPLIISQTFSKPPPEPARGWYKNVRGLDCTKKETTLFEGLTYARINVGDLSFSPLEWTSISWFSGLILAGPLLAYISIHLDHRQNSQLITAIATAIGAIFCLPAGIIKTPWIIPPYIAAIVASNTVGSAFHNRHLGLMVRGFVGATIRKLHFPNRQAISSWLSLYATAGGCLGAAAIASFTYYMLRNPEGFVSLWVVSIFSGILWFVGIVHILTAVRSNGIGSSVTNCRISSKYFISIFNYPHAAGSLVGVFLSSFSTMSIFTGAVLYIVGQLCTPPQDILFTWLTYFFFPVLALPLLHPVQKVIQSDAVKMQIFGFLLSTLTSGMGFYYRKENWHNNHVLVLAAAQSIASGVLHAHSRILLMDCAPAGREGVFAAWFAWVRMLGAFVGFAIGSSGVGNVNRSFGAAFVAAVIGIVALIFSNVSSYGGAVAAGHVRKRRETESPVRGSKDVAKVEGKEDLEGTQDRSMEV